MAPGMVVKFDSGRGVGFISPDDGTSDVILYASEIKDGSGSLDVGQKVEFDIQGGGRMGPEATNVRKIEQ